MLYYEYFVHVIFVLGDILAASYRPIKLYV